MSSCHRKVLIVVFGFEAAAAHLDRHAKLVVQTLLAGEVPERERFLILCRIAHLRILIAGRNLPPLEGFGLEPAPALLANRSEVIAEVGRIVLGELSLLDMALDLRDDLLEEAVVGQAEVGAEMRGEDLGSDDGF